MINLRSEYNQYEESESFKCAKNSYYKASGADGGSGIRWAMNFGGIKSPRPDFLLFLGLA